MPKLKLPAKSPRIDMTPMVDLFSVMLIFFVLTATVRPQEAAPVDVPFSISAKPIPDANVMTILVANDNRVFFNVDNGPDTSLKFRPKILNEMGRRYGIDFTPEELRKFEKLNSSFGVPIQDMRNYLKGKTMQERSVFETGIPIDSLDNQLATWILCTRAINPGVQTCIKGDANTDFPIVRKVLDILQDKNVNRFNLITSLEAQAVKLDEEKTQ